jgi:FtsP/CotA-like multicopper oxidase with cupredoxin domain
MALAAPAAAQDPRFVFVPQATDIDNNPRCPALPVPEQVRARGGVLRDTLTMAPADIRIGGVQMQRNVYNGQYNAPLYRLGPTDSLNILVRNEMQATPRAPAKMVDTTNQHYHGFVVTPLPNAGDNVVPVVIPSGGQNRNQFWVPPYQSQGFMWYHPHPHGRTSTQVNSGLAGGMIVGDLLRYFPEFQAAGENERVMYIKDTQNDSGKTVLNIMGNTCTRMTIRPREQQLWRIGNFSANTFVNLKLTNGTTNVKFTVLAWDGNRVMKPTAEDSLFISPGSRVEVVVTGWDRAGTAADSMQLISAPFQSWSGGRNPRVELGWLVNRLTRVAEAPRPLRAGVDAAIADSIGRLLDAAEQDSFEVRFQMDSSFVLLLNGRPYAHDTMNVAVPVGRVQRWVLINETNFLHTFHIHQTDFVVTQVNGKERPDSVHLDNVFLGIHQVPAPSGDSMMWVGDTVTVVFKFNPIAQGPFVYHCHVLAHEDNSMMGNICVYDPATGMSSCRRWFPYGPSEYPAPGGSVTAAASPPAASGGGGGHGGHAGHGSAAPPAAPTPQAPAPAHRH